MKKLILTLLSLLIILSCGKNPSKHEDVPPRDVLELLNEVPNLEVKEITPANNFSRQFEIFITQPLDHNNPDGEKFRQRIYLSHTDVNQPVVFMPSGYSSSPVKIAEISELLNANQIYVAHRFMLGAEPDNMEWQYLTIEQASADFHCVVEALKDIYTAPWISYGRSKNGQAALYHRRFYPDDVLATITVGAALSLGVEDPRYESFLNEVGTAEERETIQIFQKTALKRRDEIIPLIENHMVQSEFHFTRMNAGEILEFEILEFPFGFWQATNGDCSVIPDSTTSAQDIYNFMVDFGYFDVYSDEMLDFYAPVYYQAYTELGWYRLIDDHLQGLLTVLENPSNAQLAPEGVSLQYHGEVMQDVITWLQTSGNNIIYIYGEQDPWSASAIESIGATNALKIIQPGANHNIKIDDLDESSLVYSRLSEWLDVNITK